MTPSWKTPEFLAFLGWKCGIRAGEMLVDEKMAVIDEAVKACGPWWTKVQDVR